MRVTGTTPEYRVGVRVLPRSAGRGYRCYPGVPMRVTGTTPERRAGVPVLPRSTGSGYGYYSNNKIKWETPPASVEDHFPASIPNASHVPEVQSLSTIIQSLFSPDSIAQLLYYAKTIQELTNSTHLCLSHRQDSRQQLFWYTVVSEVLQTAAVSAHAIHPGPKT